MTQCYQGKKKGLHGALKLEMETPTMYFSTVEVNLKLAQVSLGICYTRILNYSSFKQQTKKIILSGWIATSHLLEYDESELCIQLEIFSACSSEPNRNVTLIFFVISLGVSIHSTKTSMLDYPLELVLLQQVK